MFIFPILWPILFVRLLLLTKYKNNLFPRPWDFVFREESSYWVIVHLKDGNKIGGIYGKDSFASGYPHEEQIYLEELWELDKNGGFVKPLDKSKGMIILKDEIFAIELLN